MIDGTVCFPAITRKGFCSDIPKNSFSTTLTPIENRDIHIVEFFIVDSIYSKTIDIIRNKKKFIFYF